MSSPPPPPLSPHASLTKESRTPQSSNFLLVPFPARLRPLSSPRKAQFIRRPAGGGLRHLLPPSPPLYQRFKSAAEVIPQTLLYRICSCLFMFNPDVFQVRRVYFSCFCSPFPLFANAFSHGQFALKTDLRSCASRPGCPPHHPLFFGSFILSHLMTYTDPSPLSSNAFIKFPSPCTPPFF